MAKPAVRGRGRVGRFFSRQFDTYILPLHFSDPINSTASLTRKEGSDLKAADRRVRSEGGVPPFRRLRPVEIDAPHATTLAPSASRMAPCPLQRAFFLRVRVAQRGGDSPDAGEGRHELARVATSGRGSPSPGETRQPRARVAVRWRGSFAPGEGRYGLAWRRRRQRTRILAGVPSELSAEHELKGRGNR